MEIKISEALSKDRYAIGYTCLCFKTGALKPLALAPTEWFHTGPS